MKMKLLWCLAAAVIAAACSKDSDTDARVKGIALSSYQVQIEAGSSCTVEATITPATALFTASEIVLRNEAGTQPSEVEIMSRTETGTNRVLLTLRDTRAAADEEEYVKQLRVVHEPTGTASQPLTVHGISSAPPAKPQVTAIKLSKDLLEFKVGESATVEASITPWNAEFAPEEFELLTTEGQEAEWVKMTDCRASGTTAVRFTVEDVRTSDEGSIKYDYNLVAVHVPTGVKSEVLNVRTMQYMPVVRITTQVNQSSITKDTWVDAIIEIDGGGKFEDLTAETQIKGRGNSTWGWAKKPYALKLGKKQEVMGMPKHKRWCLIANYIDLTHLRNRTVYHMGTGTSLDYTPRNEYAEFYFNDVYQGLYLVTEQIKEDENRVNITEMKKTDNSGEAVTGGYLLEFDTNYDEDKKFRSTTTNIPVNIKYPDPEDITDEQFEYIRQYVNEADEAIAAVAKGEDSQRAWELVDMQSMADFWIVFEVAGNHEILHPKSVYFHKERGQKLTAGPLWDFDYETFMASDARKWINYQITSTSFYPWYKDNWWNVLLMHDESFRKLVKSRWTAVKPFLLTLPQYITEQSEEIEAAAEKDATKWPISSIPTPNDDRGKSFKQAVTQLKSTISERIEWLDSQISQW